MIDPRQLLTLVIRPTLEQLGLWSEPAERLVLGTACVESDCGRFLKQLGNGEALGIFQMEPATHEDAYLNFLNYRPELRDKVWSLAANADAEEMIGNLYYATAMCRVHYYRVPEPIPDNLPAQAEYWCLYYNSPLGKGTVDGYINAWRRHIPASLV